MVVDSEKAVRVVIPCFGIEGKVPNGHVYRVRGVSRWITIEELIQLDIDPLIFDEHTTKRCPECTRRIHHIPQPSFAKVISRMIHLRF
jgi:hypothetical protein